MTTLIKTNSIHRSPLRRGLLLIPLVLACFALLPKVQATPDPSARPGTGNVADGNGALGHVTASASFDSAFGNNALNTLTTGKNNAAQGNSALFTSNGSKNTAVGVIALRANASGIDNTAVGYKALNSNTNDNNTAVGSNALVSNNIGGVNTALGFFAGSENVSGSNNIYIGDTGVIAENNTIAIGSVTATGTAYAQCFIGGISGKTAPGGAAVFVSSNGRLGTVTSSARFKDAIEPMDKASEAILALKPVTFRYKQQIDPKGIPQFGLVAEDVEKVNPDLVVRDDKGEIYTVRYEAVNAMLLNEFLKEHRKVQEQEAAITQVKSNAVKQEATIALQQQEIKALAANLKEQAAQIQKVSAELKVSKPAPRTVVDNH